MTINATSVVQSAHTVVPGAVTITGDAIASSAVVNAPDLKLLIGGQTVYSTARVIYTETLLFEQDRNGLVGFTLAGRNFSQTVSGHSGTVTSVSVYLRTVGTPTDAIYLEVRDSTFNGTNLATSLRVSSQNITATIGWISFALPAGVVFSAGTTYWIETYTTRAATDSTNRYDVGTNTGNAYAGGELKDVNGAQYVAGWDLAFRLYTGTSHTVAVVSAPDQAVTGTTISPAAILFSDSFPWSDGALPTVSAGVYATPSAWANPIAIASNLAKGTAAGDNAAYLPAYAGSSTAQYAATTVATVEAFWGPTVFNNGVSAFYHLDVFSADLWVFYRVVGGGFTQLGSDLTPLATTAVADVVRLEVELVGGNPVLRAYQNGGLVATYTDTDAAKLTSGTPGMRIWDTTTRLSLFEASDLTGGATATFPGSVALGGGAPQDVGGAFVTSTSVVYSPQVVTPGAVTLSGTTITSTVVVQTPQTVSPGPVTTTGATIAAGAGVSAGSVSPGPVTLTGTTITTTAAVTVGTVAPGAVTVSGASLASTVVVRVGSVTTTTTAAGATVPSTAQLLAGSVTTTTAVTGASVAPTAALFLGSVTTLTSVTGAALASTATLTAGTVTAEGGIAGATHPSTATVTAGTVSPGAVTLAGATLASTATLQVGLVTLPTSVSGATLASALVLSPGAVSLPTEVEVGGAFLGSGAILLPGLATAVETPVLALVGMSGAPATIVAMSTAAPLAAVGVSSDPRAAVGASSEALETVAVSSDEPELVGTTS